MPLPLFLLLSALAWSGVVKPVQVKVVAPTAVPKLTLVTPLSLPVLTTPAAPMAPVISLTPALTPALTPDAPVLGSLQNANDNILAPDIQDSEVEAELAAKFDGMTRSLKGAHYDVVEGRFEARFHLNKGVLQSRIKTRDEEGRSELLHAKEEFAQAVGIFGAGVKAVEGNWSYGDNLETFNALTAIGVAPEQAALETWTGRQAAKAGFTKPVFLPQGRFILKHQKPGEYTTMAVLFVRPEDVHVDREGGLWRRVHNKKEWERWIKDGKTVWVKRALIEGQIALYEFAQEERPKEGGKWTSMALYSVKDGKLTSHVDAEGSIIINPKAELLRAFHELGAKTIKGVWIFGRNLQEFNELTAAGLDPESAALATWTGRVAASLGLTKVEFPENTAKNLAAQKPGRYSGIAAHFVAP